MTSQARTLGVVGTAALVLLLLITTMGIPSAQGIPASTKIVVLGGSNAIGDGVETHLRSCTFGTVVRVFGANRYSTAAAVSADVFGSASEVFVATGENFPDAVSAGSPAALAAAPVLLTQSNALPGTTANEINRLGATTIHILGGAAAVSSAVETALSAYGTVDRLSGSNRYATAAEISKAAFPGGSSTVFIAVGSNFPDALAGAPAAAQANAPILLVEKDSIPGPTWAELNRLNPTTVFVLGGTGVISDAVASQLPGTVTRISGANRYATAAAISAATFSPGVPVIYIATGLNFPDALAGGAVAGYLDGPILLGAGDSLPGATAAEIQRLLGTPCTPYTPPTTTTPPNPGD